MTKQENLFPVDCYCIDASALVNLGWRYPEDIFPTIWKKLEDVVKKGEIISHIEVYKEILRKDDKILYWCKQNKKIFKDIDDCQVQQLSQIEKRYNPQHWEMQMNKVEPWADPWLIAISICEDAIIVTDEANKENRIPYIANFFQKECLSLLEFFKTIGIKY